MNKRPTFPLSSSLPAVSSPHFSEQFSQNPAIRYLQKASRPPTPYKLKSFLTTDLRSFGGIWLWSEDFPSQCCSASAFPGEERLVAGLPTRGCPGSRYLRALVVPWLAFGKMHWDAKKKPLCTEKVEK